ncbi:MAG: hypothetical protein HFJ05_00420 [Eubacterium sp.]|nr:hypothetical protein [Eubacterium sp.]
METSNSKSLFVNDIKVCKECHRDLKPDYTEEICPACKERLLFSRVKDYIRENDVNEFQVAQHFEIPLFKVKGWIREGRIQYKELQTPTVESLHCKECGEPISFGSLCSKCLRKSNISGNALFTSPEEEERFRFLQK